MEDATCLNNFWATWNSMEFHSYVAHCKKEICGEPSVGDTSDTDSSPGHAGTASKRFSRADLNAALPFLWLKSASDQKKARSLLKALQSSADGNEAQAVPQLVSSHDVIATLKMLSCSKHWCTMRCLTRLAAWPSSCVSLPR
jgi:hypothetical protein